ncbi:hypothetical protein [Parapedobacter sp.]
MPFANHTPYDYFPRRLHPREIGNPYLAIRQFFDWENLPEWRNHLDKWLQAALKSGFQLDFTFYSLFKTLTQIGRTLLIPKK